MPQQDMASPNVEILELKSAVFSNTRAIRVLLPPGYRDPENATRTYPVLYLNDGIMAFRPAAINVEGAVHGLIKRGEIPPLIVVGIDNGASTKESKDPLVGRANEFLPYPDVGFAPNQLYAANPPKPQGMRYPEFVVGEVMPLVEGRFRIARGPENTGIGGFSYGGVAALHTALTRPDIFGRLLLESTPLWIGPDLQLLKAAGAARRWPGVVTIGRGSAESPDAEINAEGQREVEVLRRAIAAASPGTRLRVFTGEGDVHEPAAWRRRLPGSIKFLFDSHLSLTSSPTRMSPGFRTSALSARRPPNLRPMSRSTPGSTTRVSGSTVVIGQRPRRESMRMTASPM